MKRNIIFKIIFKVKISILFYYYKVYTLFLLKHENVQYENIPYFHGRLNLSNNGSMQLGKGIVFNSSFYSNPIGINKCSIYVAQGATLKIGDYSGLSGVSIFCSLSINIGEYLFCGGNVKIWDTDFHPLNYLDRKSGSNENTKSEPIIVGNDVFIGANSVILKGCKIGDRVVIGANSVVTKDIPDDQIWAGNPAKFIKNI